MLEALLKKALKDRGITAITVESAGILHLSGKRASEHAMTCMTERGLDISAHRSRSVSSLTLADYDLFLCVSDDIRERLLVIMGLRSDKAIQLLTVGPVLNPWQKDLGAYLQCASELEKIVEKIADDL